MTRIVGTKKIAPAKNLEEAPVVQVKDLYQVREASREAKGAGLKTDRFTYKAKQIIESKGDKPIVSATIIRTPITTMWNKLFNVLTKGEFQKRLDKTPYDNLFHLRLDVKLNDSSVVGLEKNEVITITTNPKTDRSAEFKNNIQVPAGLTIKELLKNTQKFMGSKFFLYSAANNNCQDFIKAVLLANGIGDREDVEFVKQDTKTLFKNQSFLRKFSNTATDAGAFFRMMSDSLDFKGRKKVKEMKKKKSKDKAEYTELVDEPEEDDEEPLIEPEQDYPEQEYKEEILGGMLSDMNLEAKIRGILIGIIQDGGKEKWDGDLKATVKRKYPAKARVKKGTKEAHELMTDVRKSKKVIIDIPESPKAKSKPKIKVSDKKKLLTSRPAKGSQEAKAKMALLRTMRKTNR